MLDSYKQIAGYLLKQLMILKQVLKKKQQKKDFEKYISSEFW